jgi:hypothetical protein
VQYKGRRAGIKSGKCSIWQGAHLPAVTLNILQCLTFRVNTVLCKTALLVEVGYGCSQSVASNVLRSQTLTNLLQTKTNDTLEWDQV